jgi:hypothetical protein
VVEPINTSLQKLKGELITQLNVLFTAALLWISQQENAPLDPLIAALPASMEAPAKFILPVLVGILVQFAVELLRKRTAAEATAAAAPPAASE